jgi:hypothetical protein
LPAWATPSNDSAAVAARTAPAGRAASGPQPSGGRDRPSLRVHQNHRVRLDRRRQLAELVVDPREQLCLPRGVARARLRRVGVERRLERRVFREARDLGLQLALAARLERHEQALARFEVAADRLPHLVPDVQRHDQADDQQDDGDRDERHAHRLDEQTGRPRSGRPPAAVTASSTGSAMSAAVALPAWTRTVSVRSPTRVPADDRVLAGGDVAQLERAVESGTTK